MHQVRAAFFHAAGQNGDRGCRRCFADGFETVRQTAWQPGCRALWRFNSLIADLKLHRAFNNEKQFIFVIVGMKRNAHTGRAGLLDQ